MELLESKVLKHGYVRLVRADGTDADIVRTAKTSYGNQDLEVTDYKLIRYLMRKRHTQPFEFCSMVFQIKAPLDIVNQLERHRTGSFNEESGRYKKLKNESDTYNGLQEESANRNYRVYEECLATGMPKERARKALPIGTYKTLVCKFDLHNLMNLLRLRLDDSAQEEFRLIANEMFKFFWLSFPEVARAFDDYVLKSVTLSNSELCVIENCLEHIFDKYEIKKEERFDLLEQSISSFKENNQLGETEEIDMRNKLQKNFLP